MTDRSWEAIVDDFQQAAKSNAYGRLSVVLGLVEWTTKHDIRDQTLQPFLDMLRRETGRGGGRDGMD